MLRLSRINFVGWNGKVNYDHNNPRATIALISAIHSKLKSTGAHIYVLDPDFKIDTVEQKMKLKKFQDQYDQYFIGKNGIGNKD